MPKRLALIFIGSLAIGLNIAFYYQASHVYAGEPKLVDVKPVDPAYYIPGRFAGKTIIITGGARGIGRASAIRAAREGANVVVADILAKEGEETAALISKEGGSAIFLKTDVRNTEECDRMVKAAVERFGSIDAAINAAGVMDAFRPDEALDYAKQKPGLPAPIHEASDEYWDAVISANATGMFKSLRAELRQLLSQGRGGAIVNIGSVLAVTGMAGNPAYVASKHAVTGLTRNAAIDYAPYGIRINSVNMGATETDMNRRAGQFAQARLREREASGYKGPVMGRIKTSSILTYANSGHRKSTVWEQSSMILFLLSDEASDVTGGLFASDGGWTAY